MKLSFDKNGVPIVDTAEATQAGVVEQNGVKRYRYNNLEGKAWFEITVSKGGVDVSVDSPRTQVALELAEEGYKNLNGFAESNGGQVMRFTASPGGKVLLDIPAAKLKAGDLQVTNDLEIVLPDTAHLKFVPDKTLRMSLDVSGHHLNLGVLMDEAYEQNKPAAEVQQEIALRLCGAQFSNPSQVIERLACIPPDVRQQNQGRTP